MTLGALGRGEGGHTSAPSTEGWQEVTSYLDFFPWVVLNNSALVLGRDRGGGGGKNSFILEEFLAT